MCVHAEEGYAISGANASVKQGACEEADALSELPVGKPLGTADDGRSGGILTLGVTQKTQGSEGYIHGV
jgi:hypothetical protein